MSAHGARQRRGGERPTQASLPQPPAPGYLAGGGHCVQRLRQQYIAPAGQDAHQQVGANPNLHTGFRLPPGCMFAGLTRISHAARLFSCGSAAAAAAAPGARAARLPGPTQVREGVEVDERLRHRVQRLDADAAVQDAEPLVAHLCGRQSEAERQALEAPGVA